jgi:hypothetical protein
MRSRPVLTCGLLLFIAGSVYVVSGQERQSNDKAVAQSGDAKSVNDQIEVNEDRFSGVTTVKLKSQLILDKPDHQLTIKSETKLGDKKSFDLEMGTVSAYVWLESQSKGPVDFGDREVHLLIDGNSLNLGKSRGSVDAYPDPNKLKPGFKISKSFTSIFDRSALEKISQGKHIEMRLGAIELALSQPVMAALREYANRVLMLEKTSRKKKT